MKGELNLVHESDFERVKIGERAVLFYFATNSCSVGEALDPKVRAMVRQKFPNIIFVWVDMNAFPRIAADQKVFAEPTVLFYVDGKEYVRMSRNIHLSKLEQNIERIYALAFE